MALGENVLYLDGGWQQLVDALGEQLWDRGVALHCERATRIERDRRPGATGWVVHTSASQHRATSVVVASGGPDAAAALLPVDLDRSGLGEPATAACLELAVDRPPTHRFLLGLDDPLYLSVHSDAARLGPEGLHVVQVMRYGARTSDEDRPQLWAHAAAAGIEQSHVVASRFLHRMVVTGGIPVAASGGLSGRPPVRVPGHDGLLLAGDWVGDVGMLGDAAMASGELAGRLGAEHALGSGASDQRRTVLAG